MLFHAIHITLKKVMYRPRGSFDGIISEVLNKELGDQWDK